MQIEKVVTPYIDENCYIIVPDERENALVVDPGYGAVEKINSVLSKLEVTVGAVLCTHGHSDHIWQAAEIAGEKPVYIPQPDRYRFDLDQLHPLEKDRLLSILPPIILPANLKSLGGEIISQAKELIPGLWLKMVPAPGHSEGSSVFFFNGTKLEGQIGKQAIADYQEFADSPTGQEETPVSNPSQDLPLALVGDVIFANSVGRTDLPGGDPKQMLHTLRTLQNIVDPNTVLLPGHGPITVFGVEKRNNPYFAQARYQG